MTTKKLVTLLSVYAAINMAAFLAVVTPGCLAPYNEEVCNVVKAANDVCILVDMGDGTKVRLTGSDLRAVGAAKAAAKASASASASTSASAR